jgi:crotonobetainyl-CoA:carnitine CoA-transferase CaiB-like acyl-CoA transferase
MSETTPTSPAPAAGDDVAGTADAAGALPGSPAGQPPGPLSGLLVADFSRILAGPYCTMLLADLGADVIKVESPGGDDTRTWMPPVRDGVSTYYLAVNRNKRSMALDLREHGDRAAAQELAARADIVVENFKPGGLARFGLDYESVSGRNPAVIYASISGFGSAGGASLAGYDLVVQAISGLMSLTGEADGEPFRAGVAVFDVMSGLNAAIGILAALHHRAGSGRGQHVEVNLLSAALSGLVNQASAVVAGGVVPYRMGNAHPSLFPYEPLPAADGEIIIIAGNDGQFRTLCDVLGVPELADDERFVRNKDRTANRDQLRPLLIERLARRTAMEWFRDLTAAGVACGPINTVDGGVSFARQLGLEPVVTAGQGARAMPGIRNPIGLSATPARYRLPPPELDEHGNQIRRWLAGPRQPASGLDL